MKMSAATVGISRLFKKGDGWEPERGVLKGVGAEWEGKLSVDVKIHCMCIWISQRKRKIFLEGQG